MKVVAEITKWPTKNHSPEGKIIEVLGKIGAPWRRYFISNASI